jgi:hypothetical protein
VPPTTDGRAARQPGARGLTSRGDPALLHRNEAPPHHGGAPRNPPGHVADRDRQDATTGKGLTVTATDMA